MISDALDAICKCLVNFESLHLSHNPLNGLGLMWRVINVPPGADVQSSAPVSLSLSPHNFCSVVIKSDNQLVSRD